jgi:hypothetical protein
MNFIMFWISRERLIRQSKIELIDHILIALCKCELTENGREYLIKLRNDISCIKGKTSDRNRDIDR